MKVALGIAPHNGWAVAVTVTAAPKILDRRRIELLDPGLPNQPYHHETLEMKMPEAEQLIKRVRNSALKCAERALEQLRSEHPIRLIALREPPLPAPPATVAEVHASHHLLARADSMIYHDALVGAAESLGIPVVLIPRNAKHRFETWLNQQRDVLGPPWQQDHKDAAARALIALG